MDNITILDLLTLINDYSEFDKEQIIRAYDYANNLHKGQVRQSGDPYITHPLNVACILAEMHADRDTICAGLLHDTIEDTDTTKLQIEIMFNKDVANLVDGVTKISKSNFSSKSEEEMANTRKIITSITNDVRIIIIKLADRLHNMRTLEYKNKFKQKENSLETLDIFAPLAYYIGAYRIKSELEDLSFKYLKPDTYHDMTIEVKKIEKINNQCLMELLGTIDTMLNNDNIPHELKLRTKNIYDIYRKMNIKGFNKITDIVDLFALKVMVDDVKNCYLTLMTINSLYKTIKIKDYISNPKTNMYRSLHSTIYGANNRLVQTQIRTFDMDKIDSFGLTAYWDIYKQVARDKMQNDLKEKYQFFNSLKEIDTMFQDNESFVEQVKKELLEKIIHVYTRSGDIIELPANSTVIDFAYKIHTDIGDKMESALVNGIEVPVTTVLNNKDRVEVITNELNTPHPEWLEYAKTANAKRKIKLRK